MKRFIFALFLLTTPAFAADQWTVTSPTGNEAPGTIDDVIRVNQSAQDRLLNNVRNGVILIPATASTITVLPGEISIPNSAVSVVKYRETTSNTTITWADIDTGAEETSKQYYVYATGDTDITGMVFRISTSSSSPSGSTYYRKIGYFYNDSSGDIVNVGNVSGGDIRNMVSSSGTDEITTSSSSYSDMANTTVYFVSSGRPIKVTAVVGANTSVANDRVPCAVTIDGSAPTIGYFSVAQTVGWLTGEPTRFATATKIFTTQQSAGTHTFAIQYKNVSAGTTYANYRELIVEEL